MRGRAWRRYKNYTKAKRKREIDLNDRMWWDYSIYNNPINLIISLNMECMIISINIAKIKFIVVVPHVQQKLAIKDIVGKERIMLLLSIIVGWICAGRWQ